MIYAQTVASLRAFRGNSELLSGTFGNVYVVLNLVYISRGGVQSALFIMFLWEAGMDFTNDMKSNGTAPSKGLHTLGLGFCYRVMCCGISLLLWLGDNQFLPELGRDKLGILFVGLVT